MKLQIDGVDIATIDDADGDMLRSLFRNADAYAERPTVSMDRPEPVEELHSGRVRTVQPFTCSITLRGKRP